MRYLVFTNTPAQVHLFKHAVRELRDRGHDVLVLGREYGCTRELLEYYDLPFEIYGECNTTQGSLFRELPKHYLSILRKTRRYDPDLAFGMGAYASVTGALTRTPVVLVVDSEPDGLDHHVSTRIARGVLTPHSFGKDFGANHYVFEGFKECAYLHPEVYRPADDVRERLGVGPDEPYALLRFNAFGAHHDIGREGITPDQRRELIRELAAYVTVFVSDEGGEMDFDGLPARPFDLHPALLHDALAAADLLVADTQTMVTEAALLGTPAIRSNSFVGDDDMGNFLELEAQDLIYNVEEFETVLNTATSLLEDDDTAAEWERKRDAYMADKVNLTDLLVDVATDPSTLDRLPTKGTYERGRTPDRPSV